MRRVLILATLSLACLVSMPSNSAALEFEGVVLKAGAGLMSTGYQYEFQAADLIDGDLQSGAIVGVSTLWRWSRRSAMVIDFGAQVVQKGYQGTRTLPVDPVPVEIDVRDTFLSVPIVGRFYFLDDELSVYGLFGPSFEIRLSHDDDVLLNDLSGFSMAGNVGIGAGYELGDAVDLEIEFRFNNDLLDSWDGDDALTVTAHRDQSFQFTAGLRFW